MAWGQVVEIMRDQLEKDGVGSRMLMIGLTYRAAGDYRPGHLVAYLKSLKQMLGEKLLAFAWVAELQERGAVHYHLVLVVKKGTRIPLADKSGMWPHGSSSTMTVRSPYYLVKYTGKKKQKDLALYPKSCRLYAASIRLLDPTWKNIYRAWSGLDPTGHKLDLADPARPRWSYSGSAVTQGYAEKVLVNTGYAIDHS